MNYDLRRVRLAGGASMAPPAGRLLGVLTMVELLRVFERAVTGVFARADARRVVTPTLLVGFGILATPRLGLDAAAGVLIGRGVGAAAVGGGGS